MYNISRKNRRHIDYRVRAVRHCDDIKDIALKVKAKAQELINEFKALPTGRKIAVALTKLVKYVSAIYAAKTANDLRKDIALINDWKNHTIQLADEWQRSGIEETAADHKALLIKKQGLKALIGLVTALVAYAGEKFAKASDNPEA